MVTIPISAAFIGQHLVEGRRLIEGGPNFNVDIKLCGTSWRPGTY